MSYGYGIGDFLGVGRLVWKVYSAYADAPEQFRNFSHEILALHIVVKKLEDQLSIPRSDQASSSTNPPESEINDIYIPLSDKDTDDLKILYDSLKTIVNELDALLTRYQSLACSRSLTGSFDRLRWGQEDLAGWKEKIRTNIDTITAFNASLANCQLAKQSAQLLQQDARLVGIQDQLGQLLAAGLRRRGSVASLNSIASFALSIRQKVAWNKFSREMHSNGVTGEMIDAKKNEIFQLFRNVTAPSPNRTRDGDPVQDEASEQANGIGKRDRAPLNNLYESFSISITRARYFVAALSPKHPKGVTVLHMVAAKGDLKMARSFIDKSPQIDATDSAGQTALHIAADNNNSEVVKVLLAGGASIDAADNYGNTALLFAAYKGHIEVVKVLLEGGTSIDAADNDGSTALTLAAYKGHIEVVKVLLEGGAGIDAANNNSSTALTLAAEKGHTEVVKVLLEGGASIDAAYIDGSTALLFAAEKGHTDIVKVLLEGGASIDAAYKDGSTALIFASEKGHTDVVKVLLEGRSSIDAANKDGSTALTLASEKGHTEIVNVLLEGGANIDAAFNDGSTALRFAADNGHTEVVKMLLEGGASIDAADNDSRTALMFAADRGHTEVVKVLIERGADIERRTKEGENALDIARRLKHDAMIQLLTMKCATESANV